MNMLGVYSRSRHYQQRSQDDLSVLGHDKMNYKKPNVNYDKPPRKLRPTRRHQSQPPAQREIVLPEASQVSCACVKNIKASSQIVSLVDRQASRITNSQHFRNGNNNMRVNQNPMLLQPCNDDDDDEGCDTGTTTSLSGFFTCLSSNSKKHGGRYTYSALENDGTNAGERLEMERKKVTRNAARDSAGVAARAYCRQTSRYAMGEHINEIGSRIDKNWFLIRDASVKTERLMTLLPYEDECPISLQPGTREALIELFQAIQHPYIYPVLDFDFITLASETHVVTVIPYNQKGALKDLLYRSQWKDNWTEKYQQRAGGLPVKQIQRLGRQILEALLYLQDRGFPPCGHIHSGNIILQNGVARLSGLENTVLGLTSRIYPTIKRKLRENKDAIDSLCFGHVLFEMCAGYELSTPHPTSRHLEDIAAYPEVVAVLQYIFGCGEQYPSIEEILCCDFFRNLDLREMRAMPLPSHFQLPYSAAVRDILKEVRHHQKQKRKENMHRNTPVVSSDLDDVPNFQYARGKRVGVPAPTEKGSTPSSSETSTSGVAGGLGSADDNAGGVCVGTSGASSPTNVNTVSVDASPSSPEHDLHRILGVASQLRNGAASWTPTSPPEIFHTPPPTPSLHRPPSPPHQSSYFASIASTLRSGRRRLASSKTSACLSFYGGALGALMTKTHSDSKCSRTFPTSASFSSSFLGNHSLLSPYQTPQTSPKHSLSPDQSSLLQSNLPKQLSHTHISEITPPNAKENSDHPTIL